MKSRHSHINDGARRRLLTLLSGAALGVTVLPTFAQSRQSMEFVVPWPAGGVVDIVARLSTAELATLLDESTVVMNRPGAGGSVGSAAVARSAADGHTFLITSSGLVMNHAVRGSDLPFNAQADLMPLGAIASASQVIVTSPSGPHKSFAGLLEAAKARPGKLNFASAGVGSPAHMGVELLKSMSGTFITHIPYQGAPQSLASAMAGDTDFFMAPIPPALPLIKSGRLRALAVTSMKRSVALPDLPTVAELGLAGFEASQWIGLFAPSGLPEKRADQIAEALAKVAASPGFRAELASRGLEPVEPGRRAFATLVEGDLKRWTDVVRKAGIKAN